MPLNPNARFVITADDRTRAAFASVDKNLKGVGAVATRTSQFLTAALGGAVFVRASKAVIDTQVSLERITTTLRVATGSSEAAAEAFSYVANRSRELGLNFEATADSFAKFSAAARGTALEGAASREIFDSVAVAARVLSLNADQTAGTLRALEQMISKGNVQAEELRGQLGDRLPGAFQMAARAMGVTTQELDKMLKSGQVAAVDLLPKLAKEMRKTFGPEAQNAANTLGAQMERLNFQWTNLKTSMVSAGSASGGVGLLEQFVGGLAVLFGNALDPADALEMKIRDIESTIRDAKMGKDWRVLFDKNYVKDLEKEYAALVEQQHKLINPDTPIKPKIEGVTVTASRGLPDHIIEAGEKASTRFNTMALLEQNFKDLEFAEKMTDSRIKGMYEARTDLMDMLQDGIEDGVKDTADRAGDSIDELAEKIGDVIEKQGEMSEFAKEAQRNMQDILGDSLYDIFTGSTDKILEKWGETLLRMGTQALAAKLMEKVFGSGDGDSGFFGGLLSLFGVGKSGVPSGGGITGSGPQMATGTNFVPYDNFPAMLHKGEAVVPARYNPAAGGMGSRPVTIHQNISGMGLTLEQLGPVLERSNRQLVQQIQRAQSQSGQPVMSF